jgi:hypothetical protein
MLRETAISHFSKVPTIENPIKFHQTLSKLFLPRALRDVVVTTSKRLQSPGEQKQRRHLLTSDFLAKSQKKSLAQQQGYDIFAPDHFTGSEAAVAACKRLYNEYQVDSGKRAKDHFKADFLVSIAGGKDFVTCKPVLDFILSPEILRFASDYFGEVPVLGSLNLMWSPPNGTMKESQLFHRDGEDHKQLKLFLNITEVTSESGPLTLVPAPASEQAMLKLRYNTGRLSDEAVTQAAGADNIITCTGPVGQLAAVDTSRCLHFGSRNNKHERLVLFIQFVRFLAPKQGAVLWPETIQDYLGTLHPLQRRVLNFQ